MSDDAPPTVVERPRTGAAAAKRELITQLPRTLTPQSGLGIELAELLATGGMGVVYRAHQTALGRPIAFKRLLDAPSEEMRARFVREAQLTAQLDHPNIVPVYVLEPGSEAVPSGYAMKLVEGRTLAAVLDEARKQAARSQRLDADHALETRLEHFLKICDALAFAHDRGIIHRDLKPSNIMIGEFGAVYVMDWGIARPIGGAEPTPVEPVPEQPANGNTSLTRVGVRVGTPQYMSPEQAQGKNEELDARSDQYALGLLLHELIALAPAITSASELAALEEAELGQKAPLDTVDAKSRRAPNELRAIVARATALAPAARYASVRALADDVRRFLRGEAVDALPEGTLGRLLRFMSRHRRATLVAFVGVIAAAALALSWTRYRHAAAELAVRERGAHLTALYGDVARQGHHIDAELLQLEEALEGLSTAAEWALTGPEPQPEAAPLYFDVDFADPARRPADFTDKTAYRWPVSVDHPVVGVAPGADRAALLPKIRRLSPLREHIRNMVVAAAVGETTKVSPDEARTLLLARKSPIDYAYVDLPEGIHVVWPGVDALPAGYDVRTASFYKQSDHQRGKRWGAPYVDSTTDQAGDDLVLPCTKGLWSPTGEFLGVAGVEITVTKMVETSLVLPERAALRASLVDAQGRKIIDSRDAGKRFVTNGKDEAAAFTDFDVPEIVAAIRSSGEGLREVVRDGRRVVIAFVRLAAIDWYYVVEVDAGSLGTR
jgi:serine/threonine-protein kinase